MTGDPHERGAVPDGEPALERSRRGLRPAARAMPARANGSPSVASFEPPAPGRIPAIIDRGFNASLALVLLVLTAPVFVGVALLILVVDGRPILYGGRRLGYQKRPFTMFKFRTLVENANRTIGPRVLTHHHGLVNRCGRFLRDTRLDELPQLFNVLKGDMNIVGPRPERREVYDHLCKHLDGYDQRFAEKPGLVGISQLFTPHDAPKRLRAVIDNRGLRARTLFRDVFFVAYAALAVAKTTVVRVVSFTVGDLVRGKGLRICRNQRKLRRAHPRKADVHVEETRNSSFSGNNTRRKESVDAPIVDINEEALRIHSSNKLADSCLRAPLDIRIEVRFSRRFRPLARRVRTARCTGEICDVRRTNRGWAYVIRYVPASESSRYIVQQYVLAKSLASPFKS